jgi:Flp pilus assembly protein TadG
MAEVAILTVPLLILVFGTIGVGRLVRVHMAVDAVAREAARAATLAPLPDETGTTSSENAAKDQAVDDAQSRGVQVAQGYGLVMRPTEINVAFPDGQFDRGSRVTVTVQFTQDESDLPFFLPKQVQFKAVYSERVDPYRSRSL